MKNAFELTPLVEAVATMPEGARQLYKYLCEGHEIRMLASYPEPLLLAKDVFRMLGMKNAPVLKRRLPKRLRAKGLMVFEAGNHSEGTPRMEAFLTLEAVLELSITGRKPGAREFMKRFCRALAQMRRFGTVVEGIPEQDREAYLNRCFAEAEEIAELGGFPW